MENNEIKLLREQIEALKETIKIQAELISELRNRPMQTVVHQYHYTPGGYGYWYNGQWYAYQPNVFVGATGGAGGNFTIDQNGYGASGCTSNTGGPVPQGIAVSNGTNVLSIAK